MIGSGKNETEQNQHQHHSAGSIGQLLREARELVMQCRAAPSLATGMYDEMMMGPLQRGLDQLEGASVRLASEVSVIGGPSPRGGALLAAKGFDQGRLQEDLARLQSLPLPSLETAAPSLEATDLDGFLEARFEACVLGVVEGLQRRVREEAERLVRDAKEANWERVKRVYLEKRQIVISASTDGTSTGTGGNEPAMVRRVKLVTTGSGNSRAEAFLRTVQALNEARLTDSAFCPASAFRKSTCASSGDDQLLLDCWESVSVITGEDEESSSNVFLSSSNNPRKKRAGGSGKEWTLRLVQQSRRFLETTFARYMEATIGQYPREALPGGGQPGPVSRAKAFASIRAKRMSLTELQRLDMVPHGDVSIPYWLVLWSLLRAGQVKAALEYACSSEVESFLERTEPSFLSYLKSYSNGTLTGTILSQLRSDYAQRQIQSHQEDPYKLALFKVLGRCDPARRSLPDVVQTSEDYLWLQLSLLSPDDSAMDGLKELQRLVQSYGAAHFDPKGVAPLRYAQILLLVGLFEPAIAYLYEQDAYQLDAIHLAITLAYHGLLQVLHTPQGNLWDVFPVGQKSEERRLNYGLLLGQAARLFSSSFDTLSGLQYTFCLTLIDDDEHRESYLEYARQLVREAVLEGGSEASALLLGADQQQSQQQAQQVQAQSGFLPRHARLLGLQSGPTSDAFISEITLKAAEQCERESRFPEALQLYNLASQYNRVVALLSKRLHSLIIGPFRPDDLNTTLGITEAILQYYQATERIQVDLEACQIMLSLAKLRRAVEESNWTVAVSLIESTPLSNLFPLSDQHQHDVSAITRAADRLRSPPSGTSGLTCLPEALLLTMQALHGRFQSLREFAFIDPGRQAELDRIRKQARALMLLVGLLRMRIQPEVCAQLTRLDIMMN